MYQYKNVSDTAYFEWLHIKLNIKYYNREDTAM